VLRRLLFLLPVLTTSSVPYGLVEQLYPWPEPSLQVLGYDFYVLRLLFIDIWHTTEHASDIPKAGVVSDFRHGNIGLVLFSWLLQLLGRSGGYTSFVGALHGLYQVLCAASTPAEHGCLRRNRVPTCTTVSRVGQLRFQAWVKERAGFEATARKGCAPAAQICVALVSAANSTRPGWSKGNYEATQ
jgi:hypothetical protein